ncbi:MAG TPA: cell division protein CrgA, partial [Acidimicrobiales bacterium]
GGHKVHAAGDGAGASSRYTPPDRSNLPSPMWVPVLMFVLLGVGGLVIVLNYVGALGGVSNVKLVIGLALILGGIITATQYR